MVVRTPLESELEYKNYTHDLLDMQYIFVQKVTQNWVGFSYTGKRFVKEAYNKKDFTPDTRHYAFRDGKMVGFISSAVKEDEKGNTIGTLQRPFIRKDDPDVETYLMDKALKKLKDKGVTKVVTPLMHSWGNVDLFISKYKYQSSVCTPSFKTAEIDFRSLNLSDFDNPEYILEVNPVEDREELIRVFGPELSNLTPEQIAETIDNWNAAENIIVNTIMKDEFDRILAHAMIKRSADGKHAFMPHISIYGSMNPQYRETLFKSLMKTMQKTDVEKLFFHLSGDFFDCEEQYKSFGLELQSVVEYEMDL